MEYARESIFVASLRTLFRTFFGVIGVLLGIILIFFIFSLFSTPDIYPPKSALVIAPDAEGNRDLLPHTAPVVLKFDITGVIGQGDLTSDKFMNSLLDSREGMLAPDRVKAILLYMNTPGGTVDDADGIYRALLDYKKKYQVPVYAYVDGMCASGGMYIASAADKVYASSTSVIGSIGVILGPTFNFSGLMERYGVSSLTITQGKDKDMLNPFRPWKPGEDASLQNITKDLYERFVDIVTGARPNLNKLKLINDYGAQIFVSKQAQEYGYIDVADASYDTAVADLVKEAKINEQQQYQVMTISPIHPFLSELVEGKLGLLSGKVTHQFQINSFMNSELSGRFLYLYQP